MNYSPIARPVTVCTCSYRFSHEAMNTLSYRFLHEATGPVCVCAGSCETKVVAFRKIVKLLTNPEQATIFILG